MIPFLATAATIGRCPQIIEVQIPILSTAKPITLPGWSICLLSVGACLAASPSRANTSSPPRVDRTAPKAVRSHPAYAVDANARQMPRHHSRARPALSRKQRSSLTATVDDAPDRHEHGQLAGWAFIPTRYAESLPALQAFCLFPRSFSHDHHSPTRFLTRRLLLRRNERRPSTSCPTSTPASARSASFRFEGVTQPPS